MPKEWHDNYNEELFIFDCNDVKQQLFKILADDRETLKRVFAFELNNLLPTVSIQYDRTVIEYGYWNDWKGLVKVKTEAKK